MKIAILLFFTVFVFQALQAQTWHLFSTSDQMEPFTTGYKDQNGKIKIPAGKYKYCFTREFDKWAIITPRGSSKFLAIDKNEKVLFEVNALDNLPDEFSEGLIRITQGSRTGFANIQGEIVIEPRFLMATPFQYGVSVVTIQGSKYVNGAHTGVKDGKWGVIDREGNYLVPPVYDRIFAIKKKGEIRVEQNGTIKTIRLEDNP